MVFLTVIWEFPVTLLLTCRPHDHSCGEIISIASAKNAIRIIRNTFKSYGCLGVLGVIYPNPIAHICHQKTTAGTIQQYHMYQTPLCMHKNSK